METETREVDAGTEISVKTGKEVAIVVYSEEGERIYLPDVSGDDSGYYLENPDQLVKTEKGFRVVHSGDVESFEVLV